MTYAVKEIYYTLQGEGHQTGRSSVFLRFSGCNLWSGRELDRKKAICRFCDTDFWGTDGTNGGKYTSAYKLAEKVNELWPDQHARLRHVVCTGGEPALQLDDGLVECLHAQGFEVSIETNGTVPLARGIDWICVSPKAGTELVVEEGDELKLVYPQTGTPPEMFEKLDFRHFYLQPMYGTDLEQNTMAAVRYCLENPKWKLSLQTHKYLGIA